MTRILVPLLFVLSLFAAVPAAQAQQDLVAAREAGLVGERPDGLVGIRSDAPSPDLERLVEEINTERLEEYRRIAEETDAPLEAVQARAGRQIIQQLPEGQHFMDAAGRWRVK